MEIATPDRSAGVSKWDIRHKIWDYMEANNLADFPRPVHHRIPNFKAAPSASARLPDLQEFQEARVVKVNPDAPQKDARFFTLEGSFQMSRVFQAWEAFEKAREVKADPDKPLEGIRLTVLQARKTLLVPTPRLRTGLFNRIVPPPGATKEILRKCATSQGVRDYSVPVGLDAKVHVDLVVVGSVAVSEKGWRIGKGEGFADLEYAMMVSMGAIGEDTIVVTAVHDCQVVDIPEELLDDHDLTVDYILTPTRVIKTWCKRPKPQGILWHKISHEMLAKIPVLKSLRYREQQGGTDAFLKDEPPSVPVAGGPASKDRPENSRWQSESSPTQTGPEEPSSLCKPDLPSVPATVYVGNLPQGTRVSELKVALRAHDALPARLTWHGAQNQAFLSYNDRAAADAALSALQGLSLRGGHVRVELARKQGSRRARRPQ